MAATALNVTGNGPVTFVDPNGNQISVPLAALKNESGSIKIDPDSAWAKTILGGNLPLANSLVAELQTEGYLSAAPVPASKPAMVLTASNPGLEGNNITVTVNKVNLTTDPTQSSFSLVAKVKDIYPGLTVGSIASMVGVDSDPVNPDDPPKGAGLVHVKGKPPTSTALPNVLPATDVSGTIDIKSGTTTLFTLETRSDLPAGTKVQVSISLDPGGKTFTLTATLSRKADNIFVGTEGYVYPGLTVNTIAQKVGVDTKPVNPGDPPQGTGVVHVKGKPVASTTVPDALAPTDVSGTIDIKSGTTTLFTLETRSDLAGVKGRISITLDPGGTTFTLTAIRPAATQLDALKFLFTASPPASGALSVPNATLDQPLQFSSGSTGSAATLVLYARQ